MRLKMTSGKWRPSCLGLNEIEHPKYRVHDLRFVVFPCGLVLFSFNHVVQDHCNTRWSNPPHTTRKANRQKHQQKQNVMLLSKPTQHKLYAHFMDVMWCVFLWEYATVWELTAKSFWFIDVINLSLHRWYPSWTFQYMNALLHAY